MLARLGIIRTASRRIGNLTKNSLALVGLGTTIYGIREYTEFQKVSTPPSTNTHSTDGNDISGNDDEKGTKQRKRKVLHLPFHKMKIVEQKRGASARDFILRSGASDDDNVQEVELQTLIDTIHEAAKDPEVVALYATFGNGFRFQCSGFAHVEEIRNAIKVFNESHRRHYERTCESTQSSDMAKTISNQTQPEQKFSYAFADTFDNPIDSANKEYFLASAFSYVHMQPRGNLSLFGVSTSNTFLLGALQKYGIKAHVFKHGQFKNAPNALTENRYTRPHLENTKSIVQSINSTIFQSITNSRDLHETFNNKVWQAVHDYGTLTASNAQEIKLIDQLPRIDPFTELILLNRIEQGNNKSSDNNNGKSIAISNERLKHLKKGWTWLLNEQHFTANTMESFQHYSQKLTKRKKWKKKKYQLNKILTDAADKSSATEALLSVVGLKAPHFNIDEVS